MIFFRFFYHFQDEKRNSSVVESEGSSEGITSTEGLLDQKIIAEKQNLEKGSKHLPRQTWGRKVTEIFALLKIVSYFKLSLASQAKLSIYSWRCHSQISWPSRSSKFNSWSETVILGWVYFGSYRIRCRSWKCLAFPLPVLQKWRWCFFYSLPYNVHFWRNPSFLLRIVTWTIYERNVLT